MSWKHILYQASKQENIENLLKTLSKANKYILYFQVYIINIDAHFQFNFMHLKSFICL